MGTVTLSTRRTNLARLIGIHGTIQPNVQAMLDDAIQRALRYIYRYARWPFMESEWRVELEANYATGTISSSGTAVTGSGTTFPTGWTATYARMRFGGEIYRVSSIDSTTGITLTDTPLANASAGSAYDLYIERYVISTNVETLTTLWLANLASKRLMYVPPAEMDELKGTQVMFAHPTKWTTRGVDSSGDYIIEVWPIPGSNEILHARGIKDGTIVTADGDTDDIPDRFSDIVDDLARMYLYEEKKDERFAAAAQRAEMGLMRMIQMSDVNSGEKAWGLDSYRYHTPDQHADSVVTVNT